MIMENDVSNLEAQTGIQNKDQSASSSSSQAVTRKRRGFAAMDPKLVSELATKGGKAAHAAGTAHEFTSEEARVAGRKGGMATHARRRARLSPESGISNQ